MGMPRQVQSRGSGDSTLLDRRHSTRGRAEVPRRARLDFEKDKGVAIETHDIELPRLGSDVSLQGLEALALEPQDAVRLGYSTTVMGALLLSEPANGTHCRFQRVPVGVSSRTMPSWVS